MHIACCRRPVNKCLVYSSSCHKSLYSGLCSHPPPLPTCTNVCLDMQILLRLLLDTEGPTTRPQGMQHVSFPLVLSDNHVCFLLLSFPCCLSPYLFGHSLEHGRGRSPVSMGSRHQHMRQKFPCLLSSVQAHSPPGVDQVCR